MTYTCTICDCVFTDDEIQDAVQITGGRGRSRLPTLYTLDGGFHFLRKTKKPKSPQAPASEPKEDAEVQEVVSVLTELPTPPEPEETPAVLAGDLSKLIEEVEHEPLTAMQAAWRRRN